MHHVVVKNRFIFLSGWLLLTAASSMAMSLGRHSGAMLIGRPLDLSVQAVLEVQDDAGNLCLEADVFYADNKLDKSRIRVTLERSATVPAQAVIRIRSAVLIDEPVVTVYLRAGCQLKTERRYVSLAELVSEAAPDKTAPAPTPVAVPVRPAVVPSINAGTPTAELTSSKPPSPKSSKRTRAKATAAEPMDAGSVAPIQQAKELAETPKTKTQRTPTATKDSKPAAPAKARLKLEPLDLTIERDPQLKSSAELLSMPASNPQERAAASALWRALSAQPQDILRDTEKLQALENSVRGLQTQSQKTLASIDDLNVKLQQAQSERYANALVYALAALLLVALAGMAYLLRQRGSGQPSESADKPWWRKNEAYQSQQEAWIDSLPQPQQHDSAVSRAASVPRSRLVDVSVDFDLERAGGKSAGAKPAAAADFVNSVPLASKDRSDFGASLLQLNRAVKAEELFDVQQQADFFVSIGQQEQAIEVLRSHIAENDETSALVYLDLFNLYHQLKRAEEYEALRLSFNQRFNTQVPTFELYTDKNLGLEAYQQAMSRIEALWPSPKVLEIIEESLFRRPDANSDAFNLEAYRELLMLYSVAKEIISPEPKDGVAGKKFDLPDRPDDSTDSRPMTFMSTAIQPLSASVAVHEQGGHQLDTEPLMASVIPPASLRLGLDIDLDGLSAPSVQAGLKVDSDAQFFANFDAGAAAALPAADPAQSQPEKAAPDADNLIDFDIFDVPTAAPDKPAR
jgi:hypothetical protein